MNTDLKLIFWELTRRCNLSCPHCRASATGDPSPDDLPFADVTRVIDGVNDIGGPRKPVLVFSGGEVLLRDDIYDIASYAAGKGFKATLASNATLITGENALRLKRSGIQRVAVSLYGSSARYHDIFLNKQGAFDSSLAGINHIRESGIPLQINTTITKQNEFDLENIAGLAVREQAVALHIFLLVPVGRGKGMSGDGLSPREYETLLLKIKRLSRDPRFTGMFIKVVCAPHYYRLSGAGPVHPGGDTQMASVTRGCLAGTGICFISHNGTVYPCGYLPVSAGDLKTGSLSGIWNNSPLFLALRDEARLTGKCGICGFKNICGGCRARAYGNTGDYFAEEPQCVHIPEGANAGNVQ
jgi:radical SAM protein with 4Fe4S-binding SPASM domain